MSDRLANQKRMWKRKLDEDPYKALFGASEEMLKGNGLYYWMEREKQELTRLFPKWMVREMDLDDNKPSSTSKTDGERRGSPTILYPKNVKWDNYMEDAPKERESVFPQPSVRNRSSRFERDVWNCGVESPSDPRRPRQQVSMENVDKPKVHRQNIIPAKLEEPNVPAFNTPPQNMGKEQSSLEHEPKEMANSIPEVLTNASTGKTPSTENITQMHRDWQQSVLERRALPDFKPKPRRSRTDVPVIDVTARVHDRIDSANHTVANSLSSVPNGPTISKPNITSEGLNNPDSNGKQFTPKIKTDDWLPTWDKSNTKANEVVSPKTTTTRKSTSEILAQLPENDLDFLSADDIRASMGRTKGESEDKYAVRQKLEKEFITAHKDEREIDPLLKARVVSDQHVRRTEREILQSQKQAKPSLEGTLGPKIHIQQVSHTAEPETSEKNGSSETEPNSMLQWLHNGGSVLAQHFWQDPVQSVEGQNPEDHQVLSRIKTGIHKGRAAMSEISSDLLKDIPSSKSLVNRLNEDGMKAVMAAGILLDKRNNPDHDIPAHLIHSRISKLKKAMLETEKEYQEACKGVDNMKGNGVTSTLLATRIRIASVVLRKNAQLTRTAVFSLQARIECAGINQSDPRTGLLLHRLLALQDTQAALAKVVSRTMQVLSIDPKEEEMLSTMNGKAKETSQSFSDPTKVEVLESTVSKDNTVKQNVGIEAANAKLEEEVTKQKEAMRGLSDDGYSRSPKPAKRRLLDEPNPLAHSLFRPFGLQLDSLGKAVETDGVDVNETVKRRAADKKLVSEVREAYEDVFGPITVNHHQIPHDDGPDASPPTANAVPTPRKTNSRGDGHATSIQMLKEDTISATVSDQGPGSDLDQPSISQDNDATAIQGAESIGSSKFVEAADSVAFEDPPKVANGGEESTVQETADPSAQKFDPDEQDGQTITTPVTDRKTFTYRTYTYDLQTDKMFVINTRGPSDLDKDKAIIPLHEALITLLYPEKFLSKLVPTGSDQTAFSKIFDVVAVRSNMLVIRYNTLQNTENLQAQSYDITEVSANEVNRNETRRAINPIDGTTTLSPTGFVGLGSDLERELEFEERRKAAKAYALKNEDEHEQQRGERERKKFENQRHEKKARKVGVGGVIRTTVIAVAWCYVAGVGAELAKQVGNF